MAKRAPYFFKILMNSDDPWRALGCFNSIEEAFVAFKKKYGEKDVHLVRGKSYYVIDGNIVED
jgi:hypothetical protein